MQDGVNNNSDIHQKSSETCALTEPTTDITSQSPAEITIQSPRGDVFNADPPPDLSATPSAGKPSETLPSTNALSTATVIGRTTRFSDLPIEVMTTIAAYLVEDYLATRYELPLSLTEPLKLDFSRASCPFSLLER